MDPSISTRISWGSAGSLPAIAFSGKLFTEDRNTNPDVYYSLSFDTIGKLLTNITREVKLFVGLLVLLPSEYGSNI